MKTVENKTGEQGYQWAAKPQEWGYWDTGHVHCLAVSIASDGD